MHVRQLPLSRKARIKSEVAKQMPMVHEECKLTYKKLEVRVVRRIVEMCLTLNSTRCFDSQQDLDENYLRRFRYSCNMARHPNISSLFLTIYMCRRSIFSILPKICHPIFEHSSCGRIWVRRDLFSISGLFRLIPGPLWDRQPSTALSKQFSAINTVY